MKHYRKLPVVISAMQFTGGLESANETLVFTRDCRTPADIDPERKLLSINTLEGKMTVEPGDYVVIGIQGEAYPVKESIFKQTYEEVSENGGMDFGAALGQLKLGAKVRRAGWNGKGMHLYLASDLTTRAQDGLDRGGLRRLAPCIVMFTAQGNHQPGWLASQTDMLASDWEVAQ